MLKKSLVFQWILLLVIFNSSNVVSDTYESRPIEELIKISDLIVSGKVIDSNVSYNHDEIIRLSTIKVIKQNGKITNEKIIVENYEGVKNNDIIQYYNFRPDFELDQQVLVLLLLKDNGNYEVAGSFRGMFPIINGKIEGTNTSLEEITDSINSVLHNKQNKLDVEIPSVEEQLLPKNAAAKIAHTGDHLSGEFYGRDDLGATSRTIEFKINPTYAYDYNGDRIPWADLKSAAEACCAQWNNVACANVTFTVNSDSTSETYSSSPNESVICWEDDANGVAGRASSYAATPDIKLNKAYYRWSASSTYPTEPQEGWPYYAEDDYGPKDMRHIITHELGHIVGLYHCDNSNNTMYYDSGARDNIWMRSIENGDKAGAVYQVPKPNGTITFDQVWAACTDFELSNNVTIVSGVTVEIHPNITVRIPDSKKIEVEGTLNIKSGAKFTKTSGGTYWSGIDIKSTGVLDVDGAITIEYANCGIDIDNTNGLSNGTNKITIQNCYQAGIWVNNCGPTINKVECNNTSTPDNQNGGITVAGSSANPAISYVTVKSTYHGIKIATSSTNAIMDYSDIQSSNSSNSIQVHSNCLIDLHGPSLYGNNNIVRKDSTVKAINNPSTGSIDAQNNWWGVNPPTDALFSFPVNVDYSNYKTSSVPSAGADKRAIAHAVTDQFQNAQKLEFEGNLNKALNIYKDIIHLEDDPLRKKHIITSILRANDKYDKDYSDLRAIIQSELKSARGWYRASLDFILCDLLFREGKYGESIDSFMTKVEEYKGTSMEVEMLVRIAGIYGDYLDEKDMAREFADRASLINPGQATLRLAYDSAGIMYNPALYDDKFWGKAEDFDRIVEPGKNLESDQAEEFVIVNPNPFNPITTIKYFIKEPSPVKLVIYSISGQKVTTLVYGFMSAGAHSVKFDGSQYASGVYFYRFESPGFSKTGKMLLIK